MPQPERRPLAASVEDALQELQRQQQVAWQSFSMLKEQHKQWQQSVEQLMKQIELAPVEEPNGSKSPARVEKSYEPGSASPSSDMQDMHLQLHDAEGMMPDKTLDLLKTVKFSERGPLKKIVEEVVKEEKAARREQAEMDKWGHIVKAITDIVSSRWFEYLTGFIILLNMVTIGLDAELSLHSDIPGAYDTEWIKNIERGFLAVYTVELVLRLVGGGVRILTSSWFLLDAFLVTVGLLALVIVPIVGSAEQDAALSGIEKILVVRGLRLLRLVRALRMISHFKVMWRLVYSLLTAGQTMLSATALIMLSLFIFGCVSIEMIHSEPDLLKTEETATIVREHFGSLQRAIITLIQFVTLDSIAAIYYPLVQAKPYLLVIFAPLIATFNHLDRDESGSITREEVSANEQEEERNQLKKKVKRALPTLIATFNHLDRDESGSITREEIENVPIEILPSKVLENVSIDNMVDLFEMLDVEGNGRLELDEFIGGLLNLVLLDVPLWSIQPPGAQGSFRN
ncbi:Voltage-dependent L-type calcium channel subunit alpha-1S [Symbiodinium microadriaticum]|uniref:Voltage-dependent L-type calcium channel subunit alpha-1S n=1 Tax=Symbiodinium microadriaticum TaxID=2951 RepID=A0A1Q9DGV2_SYMMI|nr:Voltage-dependent L-type calcium channel subunit alpha-1S [Symbiodinium microadriaticum]